VVGAPGGGADPRIGSSARARRLGIGAALLVVAACSERPWLEGRVLDNFGRPLDRAIVTVQSRATGSSRAAPTDAGGRYAVLFDPGPLELTYENEGYTSRRDTIIADRPGRVRRPDIVLWSLPYGSGVFLVGEQGYRALGAARLSVLRFPPFRGSAPRSQEVQQPFSRSGLPFRYVVRPDRLPGYLAAARHVRLLEAVEGAICRLLPVDNGNSLGEGPMPRQAADVLREAPMANRRSTIVSTKPPLRVLEGDLEPGLYGHVCTAGDVWTPLPASTEVFLLRVVGAR